SESGFLCAIGMACDRRRRIAEQHDLEEVGRADLSRAEPVPPGGDEDAPSRALAVGCLHHLVEVAEEAGNARDLEHPADDVRPVFEGADRARSARAARGYPCLAEGEAGGHEPGAIRAHPRHQVRMTEIGPLPGALLMRIE